MVVRPSLMYRHAACVLDLDTGNRFQLPPSFAPNRQNSIDISNCLRQLLPPFQPSPQDEPRRPQDEPRGPEEAAKTAQEAPETPKERARTSSLALGNAMGNINNLAI